MSHGVIRRLTVLAVVSTLLAAPLGAATITPQQRREMSALAKQALSTDVATSEKGIEALKAYGDAANPRLLNVLKELLTRGRTLITQAKRRVSDPSKAKKLEEEIARTRAEACTNITKLAKDETLTIAHKNYDRLDPMLTLLNSVYEVRDVLRKAMVRRQRLYVLWQELGGEDRRFNAANEEKLKAEVEAILGMSVEEASSIPEFGKGEPPKDSPQWPFWFYDACRRIEAYNSGLNGKMSAGEAENVRILNAYREMLGRLPLEVDARLLQSARRHSKEMADKGYFSHESPTPENKTHTMRMKNAGYDGGRSENIAEGRSSGKGVFWMWFDSPPHHQNMVGAGSTGLGVGAWASKWTQNFGKGTRLMVLDSAEREKVLVKGDVLRPRSSTTVGRRF